MTDDHYQVVRDSHSLQELVMANEQLEGDLQKSNLELQEKVDKEVFLEELEFIKNSA